MKLTVGTNIGHDSGVCVLEFNKSSEGEVFVYEAERYTKVKHYALFPIATLKSVLVNHKELFNLPPEHYAINSYRFKCSQREQEFLQFEDYRKLLNGIGAQNFSSLLNSSITEYSHHLCHAYSAAFFAPYSEAIILIADGIGSNGNVYNEVKNDFEAGIFDQKQIDSSNFESISVYLYKDQKITLVDKIWGKYRPFINEKLFLNDGLGSYYSAIANYIFGHWSYAGKAMGLSSYSSVNDAPVDIEAFFKKEFQIPLEIFKGKEAFDNQPEATFKRSADLSKSMQLYFERELLEVVAKQRKRFPLINNLIMAGGCALNCLTTAKIIKQGIYDNVFIPPCPNDEGISIGAAYLRAIELGLTKLQPRNIDSPMAYLGSSQIEKTLQDEEYVLKSFSNFKITKVTQPEQTAAKLIAQGEVIAWFQGRSECGPRALGNRSILSLPGIKGRKDYINDHIKFRESFRPYGCSVLFEYAAKYFDCPANFHMPFMSFAPKVREEHLDYLSEVTHLDKTCRIQTVSKNQNPLYYKLLEELRMITGHPLVLNTSLNIMGQPILENVKDAVAFFEGSAVKHLIIGNFHVSK